MYRAKILITLRKSILDPQGKAIHHALESLGLSAIQGIRMGKYLEMVIDAPTSAEARKVTQEACTKLLANPVMEDFNFNLEEIKD